MSAAGPSSATGRVGVGIIGAGVISTQYLTNLTTFADVEVLFIADLDTERARERAEEFGVPGHGTVAELLATAEVEVVVNLTIPSVHVEVGEQIVAAGKHVWSEKPLALDRDGGRALLQAADRAGVRVACAPDTMLGASFQTALRTVRSGRIGDVLNALVLLQSPGPESWHPSPEFLFDGGAGPLFDIGPYYLTALVHLLGPVARVTGYATRFGRATLAEDVVSASFELESGALGTGLWSYGTRESRDEVRILGTEGSLRFSTFGEEPLVLTTAEGERAIEAPYPATVQLPLIQTVVDELTGRGTCPSTGESAVRTARVVDTLLAEHRERHGLTFS